MKEKARKLSTISAIHYLKLFYRFVLFLLATVFYIVDRVRSKERDFDGIGYNKWFIGIVWLVFVVEMIFRFFPSKIESMGCQKQFAKNYRPTGKTEIRLPSWKRTFAVAVAWLALNGISGILYYTHVFDNGILVLISLAYSVCDMICILFFCPFQTWFMKNKCCCGCRIYNWDYAMMFTPFLFIKNFFTWSLLFFALVLLIRWEVALRLYPERFSENTNESLSCKNCKEKLCQHKKQLKNFLKRNGGKRKQE